MASDDRIVATAIEYIRKKNDSASSDANSMPQTYETRSGQPRFDESGRQMSG